LNQNTARMQSDAGHTQADRAATASRHATGEHAHPRKPPAASLVPDMPPGEPPALRLAAIQRARNPLLEAARPLLRALADMPGELDHVGVEQLRLLLKREIRMFTRLCEQANIRHDHMIGARYCLSTALDSAAMETPWGMKIETGADWTTSGLATEFHEDRQGGDKVYLLIGRLMSEPDEHLDLLEVIYRILSLGFMGKYRREPDGQRKHDAVRQRVYSEIRSRRGAVPVALSPHVQPDVTSRRMSLYDFPVLISVAVLALALLGMFGFFKYQLTTRTAEVGREIAGIGRMTPPAARSLHLKELFKDDIAAGTLNVDEDARHSSVVFRGDAMFPPGGVTANPSMAPLIAKIAREIAKVRGKVTVTGYTDNLPIRSRQFASNSVLSAERAAQVMQMLQSAGLPASRLEALGKGEADPIGDNATAKGRAQNRRVDITVAQ